MTTDPTSTPKYGHEPGEDPGIDEGAAVEPTGGARGPLNRRSAYLPVLPEGWEYAVTLQGPGGAAIKIKEQGERFEIAYSSPSEPTRVSHAEDLRAAAKTAAAGAKVMDRVYKADEEVRRARDEALDVLGTEQAADRR